MKKKLIRTATVAMSLDILIKGQLAFLNEYYEVIAVSGKDSYLENVALREGVRVENVPMNRTISPFNDFVSLVKMYLLFKKEKPDIVHSITPKAGLISMVAAFFAGVPIRIHTFTGLIFPSKTGIMRQLLIVMDKIVCYFATTIYPEGEGVKGDLIQYKITKKPLNVIANGNVNGVDIDYFNPNKVSQEQQSGLRNELGINHSDFVYLFVGRLVTDKGINELVSAFNLLSKDNSNLILLLVGPYENDLDPLQKITLEGIQNNEKILTVGFQKDIRPYFSIANVFVFPSYREGFPNVVMQAGAMGLSSIVTDINGSNEIIVNNKNGLIIPSKDEIELKQTMKFVLENKEILQKMNSESRERIATCYEQKVVWNAILNEYKLTISGKA